MACTRCLCGTLTYQRCQWDEVIKTTAHVAGIDDCTSLNNNNRLGSTLPTVTARITPHNQAHGH